MSVATCKRALQQRFPTVWRFDARRARASPVTRRGGGGCGGCSWLNAAAGAQSIAIVRVDHRRREREHAISVSSGKIVFCCASKNRRLGARAVDTRRAKFIEMCARIVEQIAARNTRRRRRRRRVNTRAHIKRLHVAATSCDQRRAIGAAAFCLSARKRRQLERRSADRASRQLARNEARCQTIELATAVSPITRQR